MIIEEIQIKILGMNKIQIDQEIQMARERHQGDS
jgi:hypothetical protein